MILVRQWKSKNMSWSKVSRLVARLIKAMRMILQSRKNEFEMEDNVKFRIAVPESSDCIGLPQFDSDGINTRTCMPSSDKLPHLPSYIFSSIRNVAVLMICQHRSLPRSISY